MPIAVTHAIITISKDDPDQGLTESRETEWSGLGKFHGKDAAALDKHLSAYGLPPLANWEPFGEEPGRYDWGFRSDADGACDEKAGGYLCDVTVYLVAYATPSAYIRPDLVPHQGTVSED